MPLVGYEPDNLLLIDPGIRGTMSYYGMYVPKYIGITKNVVK